MVGDVIPGLVVLGSIRKQASNHVMRARKQLFSMVSVLAPAFRILPCLNSCPDVLQ